MKKAPHILPVQLFVSWIFLSAVFVVTTVLAYCIPNSWVAPHVVQSVAYNEADGAAYINKDEATAASTSTVSIMLSMASHGGGAPLEDAMLGAYYRTDELGINESVRQGIDKPANLTYAHYWHGWMVVLKPLLIFTDYGGIKKLSYFAFFTLLCLVCIKLSKLLRFGNYYAIALCAAFALSGRNGIDCFPYALPILVALGASLFVCIVFEKGEWEKAGNKIYVGLFIVGALTTFVDFLITPLLTLLLPLVVLILIRGHAEGLAAKSLFCQCVTFSFVWLLGYGSLWVSKWLIASVVLGYNVFEVGVNQILFRVNVEGIIGNGLEEPITTSRGMTIGPINSLGKNLISMFPGKLLYVALVAGACIVFAVIARLARRPQNIDSWVALALLVCAALPYLWFAVVSNHSLIHYYFTYRLQIASVFCMLAILIYWAEGSLEAHKKFYNQENAQSRGAGMSYAKGTGRLA